MSGGVWDHVMVNRGVYAIRCDGAEVAMLSLAADHVHESSLVREVVATFARAPDGEIGERSRPAPVVLPRLGSGPTS